MSIIKKLTAGILTLAMIFSLTACADTSWAGKTDDTQVKAGIYIYYAMSSYYQAQGKLTADQKDLWAAKIEDKDAKTWIKDNATNLVKDYLAIEKKFDELGLKLSESKKNEIKVASDNIWQQNGAIFLKNGISQQSVTDIITSSHKSDMIFKKYYDTDGIQALSEKEIQNYYNENNMRVKYIAIQLKDGEGNLFKSADKAKAMTMAEGYKSRATVENFDSLIKEYKNYYDAEVKKASKDTSSSTSDSSSAKETVDEFANEQILTKDGTTPSKKVADAIFAKAQVNTPIIIEDDEVYYVVMRLDLLKRTDLYDTNRESILYSIKSKDFEKLIDEWTTEINYTVNQDAYDRYDPQKFIYQ